MCELSARNTSLTFEVTDMNTSRLPGSKFNFFAAQWFMTKSTLNVFDIVPFRKTPQFHNTFLLN